MDNRNTVLIVDDDPALLKMAGEILNDIYAVSFAKSGFEMLELLKAGYLPDIILLDVDMPGMNGFEALRKLRCIEDAQDIPVVYLTGAAELASELEGLSSGAADYITKPIVKERLLARLHTHLEKGKRLRQLNMIEKTRQRVYIDETKFETIAADLTDTERKMLRLIALGYTNKEISESMSYSYNYVKNMASTIYEKKAVKRRSELKKLFL